MLRALAEAWGFSRKVNEVEGQKAVRQLVRLKGAHQAVQPSSHQAVILSPSFADHQAGGGGNRGQAGSGQAVRAAVMWPARPACR